MPRASILPSIEALPDEMQMPPPQPPALLPGLSSLREKLPPLMASFLPEKTPPPSVLALLPKTVQPSSVRSLSSLEVAKISKQ